MKFIVAREKPNILKLTFLQLGEALFNDLIISDLVVKFKFLEVQPLNSSNILFSIPI
jgi:hypothetical protein